MNITEMIEKLEELRGKHGDLPIKIADRYQHYKVKWVDFSEGANEKHCCVRIKDEIPIVLC